MTTQPFTTSKYVAGVPIKLLHESIGFKCTVETKNGALYSGLIINVEDCFNIQMKNVQYTDKSGKKTAMDNAYIRGSQVVYVVLPDMLRNSANLQPREIIASQLSDEKKKKKQLSEEAKKRTAAKEKERD